MICPITNIQTLTVEHDLSSYTTLIVVHNANIQTLIVVHDPSSYTTLIAIHNANVQTLTVEHDLSSCSTKMLLYSRDMSEHLQLCLICYSYTWEQYISVPIFYFHFNLQYRHVQVPTVVLNLSSHSTDTTVCGTDISKQLRWYVTCPATLFPLWSVKGKAFPKQVVMIHRGDGTLGFHPSLVFISVKGWVDPRATGSRQKEYATWKFPRTLLGTEPWTFYLVAWCLNCTTTHPIVIYRHLQFCLSIYCHQSQIFHFQKPQVMQAFYNLFLSI